MGEIVQEMYFLLLLQDYLSELQKERGDKTRWKSFIHLCIFEPITLLALSSLCHKSVR